MTQGDGAGTAIGVDLTALTEFGARIGSYATNVAGTASERLTIVFADGVQFGYRTPSADVQAARQAYDQCLAAMSEQLNTLVEAASTLAGAAGTIASEYATEPSSAPAQSVKWAPGQPANRPDLSRSSCRDRPR